MSLKQLDCIILLCLCAPETTLLSFSFFFNKFIYFIYLFLTALGLCCCEGFSLVAARRGLLFVVMRGLLIAVASLVADHGL